MERMIMFRRIIFLVCLFMVGCQSEKKVPIDKLEARREAIAIPYKAWRNEAAWQQFVNINLENKDGDQ